MQLRRNVAAVASRRRHCVRSDRSRIFGNASTYFLSILMPPLDPIPNHTLETSTLRIKSKPRAASNPDPMSSSPVYLPLHHIAVDSLWYNFSTYSYIDRALSFSVKPFRNMRPGNRIQTYRSVSGAFNHHTNRAK